jgi:formylglycine-generating enzyme required for sulfatase activity
MPRTQRVLALISLLIVVAGVGFVIGCSSDDSVNPDTAGTFTPTVVIQTDPDFLSVDWSLAGPGGKTLASSGDAELEDMTTGEYTISWVAEEGWSTPAPNPETLALDAGRQIDFDGRYFLLPGSFCINPEPNTIQADWTLTGPEGYETSGVGDRTLTGLAPGDYELIWAALDDWNAEADTSTYVLTFFGMIVTREYELPAEAILINPEPNEIDAQWTITGPNSFSQTGNGDFVLADAWPTGVDDEEPSVPYTIVYGEVADWVTPDSQTLELARGGSLEFSGTYTLTTGSATINAEPNSLDAGWTLVGPNDVSRSGTGDAELFDLAVGEYSLFWDDVRSWNTPGTETEMLAGSGTLAFSGIYVPTLVVEPVPAGLDAPWQITGPSGYNRTESGTMDLGAVDPGAYTITWQSLTGWTAPAATTVTLGDLGTIATGEYVQDASTLFVRPEPLDLAAPWNITGPGGFTATGVGQTTVTVAATGPYTLVWESVDGWITPGPESVMLDAENSPAFVSTYLHATTFASVSNDQFVMGNRNEGCRSADEENHTVILTSDFLMQTTEVTNGQFAEVMQWAVDMGYAVVSDGQVFDTLDGSSVLLMDLTEPDAQIRIVDGVFSTDNPDHPVVEISWYGAVAYCDWLSLHQGIRRAYDHTNWLCNGYDPYTATGYRLPTEAEWELACRAGTTTAYSGATVVALPEGCFLPNPDALKAISWYGDNSGATSREVATADPNAWGLYDMHGNVREWCNDRFRKAYCVDCANTITTDPVGASLGETRCVRGGFFFSTFDGVRSSKRGSALPADANSITGFRVVISN